MIYLEWIVAGILSAIFLFLAGVARHGAKNSDRLANMTLVLLLDEFAYRRQREDLLKRIASIDVENSSILYHTLLYELDDVAEKTVTRASALAGRMWRMNREGIESGSSAAGALPDQGEPSVSSDESAAAPSDPPATGFFQPPGTAMNREEDFRRRSGPRPSRPSADERAQRIAMVRAAFKVRKAVSNARRRLRDFLLGIK
jgi:hypothetical protein